MKQIGEWIAGNAPPDEGYWQALLRDGENGQAAPASVQLGPWDGEEFDSPEAAPALAEPMAVEAQWQCAREVLERGEVLELPVTGYNRGGVLVGWNDLRGFVPASHLASLSPYADEDERYDELKSLVGTRLQLKIIELDPEHRRLVLSERNTRFDEIQRQELLQQLLPGDMQRGYVTGLCSFGAFVDLGGVEGLVHISELSWGRVEHPSDVVEPGQPIEVYVLDVDRERGRVGLSVKRLQPDPWQFAEERYQVGQVVQGAITHVADFGAFVRVEEGLEGLIHVSELPERDPLHHATGVQEGDVVSVRILNIDGERRRMGLSLRQVEQPVASG